MIFTQKFWVPTLVKQILLWEGTPTEKVIPSKTVGETASKISITTKTIQETNFSGSMPVISGTSLLATKMREYVATQVAEFRKEANTGVPSMRQKFGADSPLATYTIDINSQYIKSEKTESIVSDVYSYTGGAHGGTIYKVMTTSLISGKILSLSNIIKQQEQNAFTEFVKKQLDNWQQDGNASPVFPDMVQALKFDSFSNWSLDDNNLTIYFDQYSIGPGALGAVAFPLPLSQIKNFLQS